MRGLPELSTTLCASALRERKELALTKANKSDHMHSSTTQGEIFAQVSLPACGSSSIRHNEAIRHLIVFKEICPILYVT